MRVNVGIHYTGLLALCARHGLDVPLFAAFPGSLLGCNEGLELKLFVYLS